MEKNTQKVRLGAVPRMDKVESRLHDLNIEKNLMHLKAKISTALMEFKKKYGGTEKQILVIGKGELDLLYDAHELLEIESSFKLEFNEEGFITKIWSMDIYTGDIDSFVGVFGGAGDVAFIR